MKDNRCELIKGDKITVSGKDYIVDSVIGCGASCICYKAYGKEQPMSDGNREIKAWMTIKEFYPLNIAIRNSSMKVVPASDDIMEWEKAQIRWREGIDKGRELQAKDGNDFMEIEAVDASYSVMRLRRGMTLEEWVRKNISEVQSDNSDDEDRRTEYMVKCLDILRDLCACIEKYQAAGIIHLDVKPENIYILDDNNNKRIVRLIDYDSLMDKDEFYKIARGDGKISMYSTKEYYGEEVWSQRGDWKSAAKDENVWKQVDVYALGKVLQYMLTGNVDDALFFYDNFEWFEDKDSIIERTSSRRYVLNEFVNKATNVFGRRYSDAKTLKFVTENIQGLFGHDNYKLFDGFNKYRDELVPELIVDGISYTKCRGKAPVVQVFEEYCAKQNKNICIVAESGMGKSTALRKLFFDKILENQCENRYYYYPLRNCSNLNVAKNLWHNIELIYEYPSCVKRKFLLDAFDETNENDEDLQDNLILRLNSLPENATVMLTSRFKVKELRDYKIVISGKIGLTDCSDDIIRIKNNSDWLERVGIDIFQNPLFITMSESIERIKHYIIHDKETGEKAWKKIEAELIGEYVDGKLTINYAGELLWNYIYVAILSKNISNDLFFKIIEIFNDSVLLRDEGFYNVILNKNYAHSYSYWEEKKNDIVFKSIILELKNLLKSQALLIWFFKAKSILSRNSTSVYVYSDDYPFDDYFTGGNYVTHRKTICIWNLLMEMSGSRYNKFEMYEDYCETNITQDDYNHYINEIYVGDRRIVFKGGIFLSRFQKAHRYFIYSTINCFNAIYLLLTQSVISNINFSNLNLKSLVLRFGKYEQVWKLNCFNTVNYCCFSNCSLQAISGNFNHCLFTNLKADSYLFPQIYQNNICDKQYGVIDAVGNIVSVDNKEVIQIIDGSIFPFDKYNDLSILAGALDNCINEKIIMMGVRKVDLTNYKMFEGEDYNVSVPKLKTIIIFGNAIIRGLKYIANIEVYDNENYLFLDGILYDKNDAMKIVHINQDLPETVHLMLSAFCADEKYQVNHIGCKKVILCNNTQVEESDLVNLFSVYAALGIGISHHFDSFKIHEKFMDYKSLKPIIGLEEINNLPDDFKFIFNCLVKWEIVDGEIKKAIILACFNDSPILYIPSDLGFFFVPCGFWLKETCKIFSPVVYIRDEGYGENMLKAKNSLKDVKCNHEYDFYFGGDLIDDNQQKFRSYNSYKKGRIIHEEWGIISEYNKLMKDEKNSILNQRNQWIEYIKSLPPGKKYR